MNLECNIDRGRFTPRCRRLLFLEQPVQLPRLLFGHKLWEFLLRQEVMIRELEPWYHSL